MTKHVDHITLEVSNGTTHATRYDADDKAHHSTPDGFAWRLHRFTGSPLSLWFQLLMRWDTIDRQDTLLQREVDGKSVAGGERAKAAFVEYAAGIQQPVALPVFPTSLLSPNYALCMVYLASEHPHPELEFRPEMFLSTGVAESIKGWEPSAIVPVQGLAFTRGGHSFVAAAACPPGEITETAMFGFPNRKRK